MLIFLRFLAPHDDDGNDDDLHLLNALSHRGLCSSRTVILHPIVYCNYDEVEFLRFRPLWGFLQAYDHTSESLVVFQIMSLKNDFHDF